MDGADDLEVVAACFREPAQATEVAERLRSAFDLDPTDVVVASLGGSGEFPDDCTVVLAGRFAARRAEVVADVVRYHGGYLLRARFDAQAAL